MAEPPVINASPLIHFGRTDHLSLLTLMGPRLVVPEAVAHEVRAKGPDDVAARALASAPWLAVVAAHPIPQEVAVWDLGAGEASVLAWARLHPGSLAILDDLQGRRCAAALGLPVIGTLGVVLLANTNPSPGPRGRVRALPAPFASRAFPAPARHPDLIP